MRFFLVHVDRSCRDRIGSGLIYSVDRYGHDFLAVQSTQEPPRSWLQSRQ